MANTIDLRGLEQIATCKEAEQYAAHLGYEMFMWLDNIYDVDPNAAEGISEETNRLYSKQ